jgi:hypothetical protein
MRQIGVGLRSAPLIRALATMVRTLAHTERILQTPHALMGANMPAAADDSSRSNHDAATPRVSRVVLLRNIRLLESLLRDAGDGRTREPSEPCASCLCKSETA